MYKKAGSYETAMCSSHTSAYGRNNNLQLFDKLVKSENVRDCAPSERAFLGLGWTSIIRPSAPTVVRRPNFSVGGMKFLLENMVNDLLYFLRNRSSIQRTIEQILIKTANCLKVICCTINNISP